MNYMDEDKVRDKLISILKEDFSIDMKDYNWNEKLLGTRLRFSARDLLFFLYKIESSFNIRIPNDFLIDKKFNSLSNILEEIKNCLKEKGME